MSERHAPTPGKGWEIKTPWWDRLTKKQRAYLLDTDRAWDNGRHKL